MQKSAAMLAAVGGLVAAGIVLSFYGSMIITEDLAQASGNVGDGGVLEVSAVLDPSIGDEAAYVVQAMELREGAVAARVIDPSGGQIASGTVGAEPLEERFAVTEGGTFTLIVENSGDPTDVVAAIGHVPDASKFSVGISGFYLLIAGLVGMGAVGVYAAKNRRRG